MQAQNHDTEEAGPVTDAKTETDTTPPLNGNVEGESSHNTPEEEEHASANDFNSHAAEGLGAGGVTMTFLGFKEVEPGQGVDEDDDGGAIIRAERVILTDEGEEIPKEDDKTAQEPTVDDTNEDTSGNTEEKTENHPEASADPAQAEEIEDYPAEEIPIVADVAVEVKTQDIQDLEQEERELPESTETQPQVVTVDGAIEASQVPMYSKTQASPTIRAKVEANTIESQTPKDEEVKRISLSQFQEVPLDGAGETAESNAKTETEKQRAEHEPLLVSRAAAQLDTSAANRAEDAGAPKQKTCQCCSIMWTICWLWLFLILLPFFFILSVTYFKTFIFWSSAVHTEAWSRVKARSVYDVLTPSRLALPSLYWIPITVSE